MKIVHLITRLIVGGAQENTISTCEDQLQHGHRVTLITGPTTGPEGSLVERARRSGVELIEVPSLIRSVHPWHDAKAYFQLKQLLRSLQPDIVHTHSSKAGIVGRRAAWDAKLPVVHTIHGASFHYGQSQLISKTYVSLERMAARWTDHFISVADDMSAEYVRAGIAAPDRFTTVYSGFDVEPFLDPPRRPEDVRRELGFGPDDVVIGKIGRLFHLKGHEFLLQAAPRIIAAAPQARFLFVGDGILREQFEQQIARDGLSAHFKFTGLVPPTQIPELMGAMDIVTHTSQWEGLARVLPQGLIAGKPVVSYDVGGAREVVRPGETGYLLPRDSVDPLVDALLELITDPEKRARYGRRGRELFTDRFRHQTMTAQIQQVYEQVLDAKRGKRDS